MIIIVRIILEIIIIVIKIILSIKVIIVINMVKEVKMVIIIEIKKIVLLINTLRGFSLRVGYMKGNIRIIMMIWITNKITKMNIMISSIKMRHFREQQEDSLNHLPMYIWDNTLLSNNTLDST